MSSHLYEGIPIKEVDFEKEFDKELEELTNRLNMSKIDKQKKPKEIRMSKLVIYQYDGFTNCGISYRKFSNEKLAEIHATRDTKEGHHDVMSNNAYKQHIQEEGT